VLPEPSAARGLADEGTAWGEDKGMIRAAHG
jgi:hypothetical protein